MTDRFNLYRFASPATFYPLAGKMIPWFVAAGILFAKTEGIIPAPESTHAIAAAIREALQAKEEGTPRTILFNLSGNGVIDLYAYEQYLAGALRDYVPGDDEIAKTVSQLSKII